jgi:hypothetical protein
VLIGIPPPLVLNDRITLPLLRNVLDVLGYAAAMGRLICGEQMAMRAVQAIWMQNTQ